MGGAKFMGRDTGIPFSEAQMAFDVFIYWLLTGWLITFGIAMLICSELNIIPGVIYFGGLIFFWCRYVRKEKRSSD